jgi:hypothetical protein
MPDIFDMLMQQANSDQFSCGERLRLAAKLIDDAHGPGRTPFERARLFQAARRIIQLVDKHVEQDLTAVRVKL